jgi:zinc D-Ala-D-Ala carboxypeptidase
MTKARQTFGFRLENFLIAVLLSSIAVGCARAQVAGCEAGPRAAAQANALSLSHLSWAPFGRPEIGWEIYQLLAAKEIGSSCPGDSPAFAARLATWQSAHGLAGRGLMDVATLSRMKQLWESRRPFVAASRLACPAPPFASSLTQAGPTESYGGKVILLRPAALADYRAMAAAARRESAPIAANRRLLTIFSAFRSPAYDDARCALQHNCQGITRAACSAHRTGLAMDLYLGAAPGFAPDSSDDANRLFLSRSAAYRWLVLNAGRFGFFNYPFEPWHWEWVGEAP